jgi:hypothetical protein
MAARQDQDAGREKAARAPRGYTDPRRARPVLIGRQGKEGKVVITRASALVSKAMVVSI